MEPMRRTESRVIQDRCNAVRATMLAVCLAIVCLMLIAPESTFAQTGGAVPGNSQGSEADSDFWRQIRSGTSGTVSIPDERAGTLIQSEGDNWRAIRNGPLPKWGGWAMFGSIAMLALFFALRGRIKIEHGRSGRTITRFNWFERMSHWLLAVSFIILAVTGIVLLFGKWFLLPIIGPEAFASFASSGKWLHNYVAFAFMAGLVLVFLLWVLENIPNRYDLIWLGRLGGIFSPGAHPPAKKFNAGQKILFWIVILAGISISISGISLLLPFQTQFFAETFAFLNWMGFTWAPDTVTPMEEMQYSQIWHSIVAFVFIAVIIGHIYIGTLGMEGAFDAMGTGDVDVNWAKEHHSLWADEVLGQDEAEAAATAKPKPKPKPKRKSRAKTKGAAAPAE